MVGTPDHRVLARGGGEVTKLASLGDEMEQCTGATRRQRTPIGDRRGPRQPVCTDTGASLQNPAHSGPRGITGLGAG